MLLPSVKDLQVFEKKVLLRTDYDVSIKDGQILDTTRIDNSLPTINYLLKQKAKIIIISHLGRPEGKVVPELSLKPVATYLNTECGIQNTELRENLRFDPEEESNDPNFAKKLAGLADIYVNEAFAVSHRPHASIIGVPKFLPSFFGINFIKEVNQLSEIRNNPERPVTLILGGAKEDKLKRINELSKWADQVLIGGRLPAFFENYKLKIKNLIVAELNQEGKDISENSIEKFKALISDSGTIIWSGPMGVYEEDQFAFGTRAVAQAIIESSAYSVIGGGDTEAALTKLGFDGKMNYISSGGGAMLEFLATGTLVGIEAVTNQDDND